MPVRSLLAAVIALWSGSVLAQDPADIRGGWIAELDGTRHVYQFVVAGTSVTGIHCTDCSDPRKLAFIDDGVLGASGVRFKVYHDAGDGRVAVEQAEARPFDGRLVLTRRSEGAGAAPASMLLQRSPVVTEIRPAPPGGFVKAPPYTPPGPPEMLSVDRVLGLWLFGSGPNKQYFMFKRHKDGIRGMVCGPCTDAANMAPLENVRMDGTRLHFDIVHEDSGPGILEHGPHRNVTVATIARNEMHIAVVPSFEPADFTPIEMTLLGPVQYRP